MKLLERWNLHHRAQHVLLMLSMIDLIGTGMPLRFSQQHWAQAVAGWFGGPLQLLAVHKAGAVALVLVGIYHIFYMGGRALSGRATWSMLPSLRDLRDARDHASYLLGFTKHPPQYDRYSYLEKFEYLAVFWGMVIMGLSGFALWFPLRAASILPGWGLHVARIIHSNEALVALLAIAVGHFYYVFIGPRVFPFSRVWFTGRISQRELAHEHPLEYQRLVEQGTLQPASEDHAVQLLSPARRLLAIAELGLYGSIFYLLLRTFVPLLLA